MFHVTARIFTSDNMYSLDNVTWLKKHTFFHERIFQKYYWLIFVQFFMWFYTGYRISYNYKSDVSERGNFKGQKIFLYSLSQKEWESLKTHHNNLQRVLYCNSPVSQTFELIIIATTFSWISPTNHMLT